MDMTNEELNRYIHEARGLDHNHIWEKSTLLEVGALFVCKKCSCAIAAKFKNQLPMRATSPPNYLEHGKAWGELLNWAKEQEWWSIFVNDIYLNSTRSWELIETLFANPRSLPEHIVSYLKQEEVNGNTSASS